ncbi:hypothetical protein D3C81_1081500 [compost metagenome]
MQLLAIHLRRVEGDAEGAGRADHGAAQYRDAIGGEYTHGAARFGAPGNDAAVRADSQFARDRWRCDIGRRDLRRQGGRPAAIDGTHVKQPAVGLCRGEYNGEGAFGADHDAADQRAVGVAHFDTAAGRGIAGEGGAIGGDHQVAGAVRCRCQRHFERQRFGRVATRVGLHQAQLRAGLCGRVKVDQEGAVGADHAGTDQSAIGIAHLYGGAGFTTAAQGQATIAYDDRADFGRRSHVRGIELKRR